MIKTFRYLALATLSSLFIQCTDKQIESNADDTIRFAATALDSNRNSATTKGVTGNALQSAGSAFSIIGAHADDKAKFPENNIRCFENQSVAWDGSWSYSPSRYWVDKSHYRFRAVHPASCATEDLYADDLHSEATLKFTVDSDPAKQVDILMTDLVTVDYVKPQSSTIDLVFKHLLCRVNVNIKTVDDAVDEFTIDQITLIGPGSEWTLESNSADNGDSWASEWKRVAGSPARQFSSNVTGKVTSTTGEACFGSGLLLVPESNSNAKLRVVYKVAHGDGAGGYGSPKPNTVEYAFPASPAWEAGKSYTYTLTMAEQYNIKFGVPTVRDWGEIRNTGTIVIK